MPGTRTIRRFAPGDETELTKLIHRGFLEVNIRDYTREALRYWCDLYTPDHVLSIAANGCMYVAEENGRLLGTCTVTKKPGGDGSEGYIEALYVDPDHQGEGIASALLAICEQEPSYADAKRLWVDSSITARTFYEQHGYRHETGEPVCIENDRYVMYKESVRIE